ncbi:MAG TPA: ATP-binding cassette domain-containing protein [Gammaproteobacteria bacterium]|nr:ATP-binding cassette domain-containing protein [Gammaproteobacteria bacterium]
MPDRAAPAPESLAAVTGLALGFGDRRIVEGLEFEVARGEIFAIMGASGVGKSTLLRTLIGLAPPATGAVALFGQDPYALPAAALYALRRRIGVAFQGGALLNALTVLENVELPLKLNTRLDRATIRIMAHLKLELLNLREIDHLYPSQLSGGMAKRVSLARAVVMDPELVFFDEPAGGLDARNAAELDELILKLRAAMNCSFVVVTHALDSAFTIADRVLVLAEGRALALGTPQEVRALGDERMAALFGQTGAGQRAPRAAYLDRLTAGL